MKIECCKKILTFLKHKKESSVLSTVVQLTSKFRMHLCHFHAMNKWFGHWSIDNYWYAYKKKFKHTDIAGNSRTIISQRLKKFETSSKHDFEKVGKYYKIKLSNHNCLVLQFYHPSKIMWNKKGNLHCISVNYIMLTFLQQQP